jgi:hypothetical protein
VKKIGTEERKEKTNTEYKNEEQTGRKEGKKNKNRIGREKEKHGEG